MNDHKNDFQINLHECYVAEVGFDLVTPGSVVRLATYCTMEPVPEDISVVKKCIYKGWIRDKTPPVSAVIDIHIEL